MARETALSSDRVSRLFVGLVAMPPTAAVVTFLLFPVIELTLGDHRRAIDPIDAALSAGTGVGIVALVVTFVVAPRIFHLARRGRLSIGQVLITGAYAGNAPLGLVLLLSLGRAVLGFGPDSASQDFFLGPWRIFRLVGLGTIVGMSSAGVFFLIVGRDRHVDRAQ